MDVKTGDRRIGTPKAECLCRSAVERCYVGLCRTGASSRHALEAAARVYRYHHPAATETQAEAIVRQWVDGAAWH